MIRILGCMRVRVRLRFRDRYTYTVVLLLTVGVSLETGYKVKMKMKMEMKMLVYIDVLSDGQSGSTTLVLRVSIEFDLHLWTLDFMSMFSFVNVWFYVLET